MPSGVTYRPEHQAITEERAEEAAQLLRWSNELCTRLVSLERFIYEEKQER